MAENPRYFDPQTLAKLQGLRLRARSIVEGYVSGLHRSPYRGFSVEFSEHREYVPGDDLRHVDWKLLGRADKVYVKRYEDETNLICYLVLDASESMQYRGPGAALSKFEYAQAAAAALAWLVLQGHDAVGVTVFDSRVRHATPPAGHAGHLEHVFRVLEPPPRPGAKTAVGAVLHALAQQWSRRGVVVLLSDLLEDADALAAGLRRFRHRRHDVMVLQVLAPAELDFPFDQATLFRGLEGLPHVTCDPRTLRRAYLEEMRRHCERVRTLCLSEGVGYQTLRTDEPLDQALPRWLAQRAARRA